MTDLGPGEVLERFRGDLDEARIKKAGLDEAASHASLIVDQAQSFRVGVNDEARMANVRLRSIESTTIAAIEATMGILMTQKN